jgi:hypothetical protein
MVYVRDLDGGPVSFSLLVLLDEAHQAVEVLGESTVGLDTTLSVVELQHDLAGSDAACDRLAVELHS